MTTKRSTSIESNVENVENAFNPPVPPKQMGSLTKQERYYFDSYAKGKSNDDWFEHELNSLVDLSRISVELDKLRKQLKREGPTVPTVQGGIMSNPLIVTVNAYATQKLALQRSLNLASSATLKKEHVSKRADKQRETATAVQPTPGMKPRLLAVPISR